MKLQTFLINMELFFINNKDLIIQRETNEHVNDNGFIISNSNKYYVYTLSEYFIIYTTILQVNQLSIVFYKLLAATPLTSRGSLFEGV